MPWLTVRFFLLLACARCSVQGEEPSAGCHPRARHMHGAHQVKRSTRLLRLVSLSPLSSLSRSLSITFPSSQLSFSAPGLPVSRLSRVQSFLAL